MKLIFLLYFLMTGLVYGSEIPSPIDQPSISQMRGWIKMHAYLKDRVSQARKKPSMDIYFLGDSLTEYWLQTAPNIWNKEYGSLQVINCGVAGDTVQNVLYRITNGEFDGIKPKVIVLLIGINNLGRYPDLAPEELVKGTKKIITILKGKSPSSKILLISLFPAGARAENPVRSRILKTNTLLKDFADEKTIFYLDLYNCFLDSAGRQLPNTFLDELHLAQQGYQIWADNMRPLLNQLLNATEKQ